MSDDKDPEPWDHTYKGDAYWLDFRSRILVLLEREIAVSFADVEADPWFQKESHIEQAIQWDRARKRMVRGRPKSTEDKSDLVQFSVEGRGGNKWYLARIEEMHCASVVAVLKERVSQNRRRHIITHLRKTWNAYVASCPVCLEDRVAYNGLSNEPGYAGYGNVVGNLLRLGAPVSNPKQLRTHSDVQEVRRKE